MHAHARAYWHSACGGLNFAGINFTNWAKSVVLYSTYFVSWTLVFTWVTSWFLRSWSSSFRQSLVVIWCVVFSLWITLVTTPNHFKREQPFSTVMSWLHCYLYFSLLRSTMMCLRGSPSRRGHVPHADSIDLVIHERRVPSWMCN